MASSKIGSSNSSIQPSTLYSTPPERSLDKAAEELVEKGEGWVKKTAESVVKNATAINSTFTTGEVTDSTVTKTGEITSKTIRRSANEPNEVAVTAPAATRIEDIETLAEGLEIPDGVKVADLAKEADTDGDGLVTAAEWKALSEKELKVVKQGNSETAGAAGDKAGVAAQLAARQSTIDNVVIDLKTAIDTSPGIGNGDGVVTREEIEKYAEKQNKSGDAAKQQMAAAALEVLSITPAVTGVKSSNLGTGRCLNG